MASRNLQEITIDNKLSNLYFTKMEELVNAQDNMFIIIMNEFRGTTLNLINANFNNLAIETLS